MRQTLRLAIGTVLLWCCAALPATAQNSAAPRFVPTLGPSNKTVAVAYSSDGRLLVTGGADGVAILWDLVTASEVRRIAAGDAPLVFVQFCDRDRLLLTGDEAGRARLWDVATSTRLREFPGHVALASHDYVFGAPFAVSDDASRVFTADDKGHAHIWERARERERVSVNPGVGDVGYATFSRDGSRLLVSGDAGAAMFTLVPQPRLLWRHAGDRGPVLVLADERTVVTSGSGAVRFRVAASGQELASIPLAAPWQLSASPDGARLLVGTFSDGASLWDIESKRELWRSPNPYASLSSVLGLSFAPDGRSFAYAAIDRRMGSWDGHISIHDTASLDETAVLRGRTARLLSLGFLGSEPYVLAANPHGQAFLWRGDRQVSTFTGHIAPVIEGKMSPESGHVLLGSLDRSVSLWSSRGEQLFHFTGHSQYIASTAFSPDGKIAYSAGGPAWGWDVETGRRTVQFGGHQLGDAVLRVTPMRDGHHVITQTGDLIRLWTADGKEIDLPGALTKSSALGRGLSGARITADGRLAIVNCSLGPEIQKVLDIGLRVECTDRYPGDVHALSADGATVISLQGSVVHLQGTGFDRTFDQELAVDFATLSHDNTLLLVASLQDNVARLWRVEDGRLLCNIVLTTTGQFVVFDAEGRFDTNDIEKTTGMNWLMPGAPSEPAPLELFMRDYYAPGLLRTYLSGSTPTTVPPIGARDRRTPRVVIERAELENGGSTLRVDLAILVAPDASDFDALDLHLFRDGQLVATLPSGGGPIRVDRDTHRARLTVSEIQLPASAGKREVTLSAYAFNSDGVKGPTTTAVFKRSTVPQKMPRTAYVVVFGVNLFEDTALNLRFAANDARAFAEQVRATLRLTRQFDRIVVVPLISDTVLLGGERSATKDNLRHVLASLAWGRGGAGSWADVARATPDDVVFLHVATHGFTDTDGTLHVLSSGAGSAAASGPSRFGGSGISSGELTEWLRPVDAGEIVVVIDACHSAAVAGREFKPAPLGDRGFGQLAYNKKMRVLVGAQADAAALELDRLQHGLLSYSLLYQGLAAKGADVNAADGSLTVTEWLDYPVQTLERLQRDLRAGRVPSTVPRRVDDAAVRSVTIVGDIATRKGQFLQRPALFDFGGRPPMVMWGEPFFDPARVSALSDERDDLELVMALNVADPRASAAALRRFIGGRPPGQKTAAAWVMLFARTHDNDGASARDLVSAARMALSHLSLLGRSKLTDRQALDICDQVVERLARLGVWSDVQEEFRQVAARLRG